MTRRPAVLLATAAVLLALPAAASAKDFCVGGPAGCTGTAVASDGLAAAMTAAESNGSDDRFFLAPGSFAGGKFSHQSGERLELIGAGAGKTIMRGDLDGSVLTLGGNQDTTVADLTLEPVGAASAGLTLLGTHARGVAVDAKGVASLVAGVQLFGDTTFDDGSVDLGTITQPAVVVFSGTGVVTDSTLRAPAGYGFVSGGTEGTVRRSTLDAAFGAVAAAGHLSVSDSLIDLRGHTTGGTTIGMLAGTSTYGATSLTTDLDRVTIVGSTQETIGVAVEADGAGKSSTVHVRDAVIQGAGVPVARQATNGATADLTTDRSSYPLAAIPLNVGPGSLVEEHHLSGSPRFVDAGGDFHLAPDSPLIDAGTPGDLPAGTTDRDGNQRASDGDGNCTHISDIGAFERQGTTVKALATASAASAAAGRAVGFSSDGSCIPGAGAPTVSWSFDDGAGAAGTAVTHAFATPGRHTATLTVSDGDGHQALASVGVDVTAPPATPAANTAPVISGLRVAPKRIAIGSPLPKLMSKAPKRPVGTIRFTLSKAATVELRFAKLGKRGATRAIKRRVRIKANQGFNRIRFAARLTRKLALKPGAYKLTLSATDATGARSKPATARFTAKRR